MKKRGMRGVFNIVTVLLDASNRLNPSQLLKLQSEGNEIASHSHTHPNFKNLSYVEIRAECETSKHILESYGLVVKDFVFPGGTGGADVDAIVSEYYRSGRYGWGLMSLPHNEWKVTGRTSYGKTDVEDLANYKAILDEVASSGKWTILYFHSVSDVKKRNVQISAYVFAEVLD